MLRRPTCLVPVLGAMFACCGGTTESPSPAGVGGTGGASDASTEEAGPPSLKGLSFDIKIPKDDAGFSWCIGQCDHTTVYVENVLAHRIDVIWGTPASAAKASLEPDGAKWKLMAPVLLGSQPAAHVMCLSQSSLETATFDFADHDKDGALDLVIQGHQSSKYCSDDYSTTSEGDVVLTGRLDATPPSVMPVQGPIPGIDGLEVVFSEPIAATASASMSAPGAGEPFGMLAKVDNGYVVGFSSDVVLGLGLKYTATFVGQDLAAVGTPAPVSVDVLADFGVLAQDGFESGSMQGISPSSGPAIVDASGGLTPITGQRTLYVPAGTRTLLRLQRAGSEKNLVMNVRKLSECYGDGPLDIIVAVIGSSVRQSVGVSLGTATTVQLEAGTIQVGELTPIQAALEGSGKDVLVSILGDRYQGAGCLRIACLIDDVKLQ